MRTFTVSLLFLVVLINGIHGQSEGGPERKQICEPGAKSKVDCNTCTCSLDGTALGCTRMACPRIPEEYLNPDGSLKLPHQINPLLRSKRRIVYKRSADSDNGQICEPGAQSKMDCNTCTCSSDGTALGCTRMECPQIPEEFLNPDGSIKLPHQSNPLLRTKRDVLRIRRDSEFSCEPESTWKDDCNTCFCAPDGRNYGCTLMACPPRPTL